jgi:hypothetical protein
MSVLPFGPPEDAFAPEEEAADPSDLLRQILDLAAQYRDVEPDEEDKLAIEQATTLIQKLLAKQQKDADGMMQGKLSPSGLRRTYGG